MTDYQKYQLQWMIDHNHSLDELISELTKCEFNRQPEDNIQDLYEAWEHDCGFGSEIWACIDEWQDCEAKTEKIDQYLADALDECDTIIPELEGFDNSQKLYETNKEFRLAVAEKYSYYWFNYLADCGDARFECVIDALAFVYKEWKEENCI